MKVYTRGGDRGETGLADGSRVPKDHLRVAAYGELDELNAVLGVVVARTRRQGLRSLLVGIQRDLFVLGSQLADPLHAIVERKQKAALDDAQVARLEGAIDRCQAALSPLRRFILPGGSPVGALLHQARTVCRRAERSIVALARRENVDTRVVAYVNRLSDLLFVLAREENRRSRRTETPW